MLRRVVAVSLLLGGCAARQGAGHGPQAVAQDVEQASPSTVAPKLSPRDERFDGVLSQLRQRELEAAHVELERWLKEKPKDPDAFYLLAHYYMLAAERSRGVIRPGPPTQGERLVLTEEGSDQPIGHFGVETGYAPDVFAHAIEAVDQAVALAPSRVEFPMFKAYLGGLVDDLDVTLLALRGLVHAQRRFGESLTSNREPLPSPSAEYVPQFIHNTAVEYVKQGDATALERAEAILGIATESYPHHVWAFNLLAAISYQRGNLAEARRRFLDATAIDPNDELPLFNAAQVSLELSDEKTARDLLQQLVKRFPDTEDAATARQLLHEMDAK